MAAQPENAVAPRILLVEDNYIAQLAAKGIIETKPNQLIVASSGEEAIIKTDESLFDIIFMDIGLGGMSGFEATAVIRQHSKFNKDTLIFALTAHGDSEYREKAKQVEMNGFFQKPLTREYLEQVYSVFKERNTH